jgi:LPS O-antigen subunit length determinant protein (WzzB/FepE family)
MQQNLPEQNYYQEDEIDLKQLFRSLADRKWFIFGFTGLVTALAIAYALSIPPTYKASTSFLSPSTSSVLQLNKIKLTSETSETIYRKFLNKVLSSQFQRKIFDENDYLAKLNPENKPIENLEDFFAEFSKSINLETNKVQKNVEKLNYEKPVIISLEGNDSTVISNFLNDLANTADTETVSEFLAIIQQKIDIRLEEINKQRVLLLSRTKQDRLSKIERIKIEDGQKINELNDQIVRLRIKTKKDRLDKITRTEKDNQLKIEKIIGKINRLRIKAKKDRLNKIQVLSDTAKIAEDLNIIDNNFKKISSDKSLESTLTVSIGDNQKIPQWYLYGKDALLKEASVLKNRINDDAYIPEIVNLQNEIKSIKDDKDLISLKNRTNDDPYISEIVNLQNELSTIESNQILKTLESRKDDSPFVAEINKLDIEAIKLKSFKPSSAGINAMQLNQHAYPPETPIKPKKILIVVVAFIAGFILSIFLVFIMNAFRKEEDKVAV